jgi:hypothetical protein
MKDSVIIIDWEYSGKPDGFFGTGATAAEQGLVWGFGVLGTAILGWVAWTHSIPWTWWQYVIAALISLDVLGGVTANALNSCKRFYHAPLQTGETGFTGLSKNHYAFVAFHVHTLIVGILFGGFDISYGFFWYAALIVATLLVLNAPLYLQRPLALGLIMTAILVNLYIIHPVPGFEWLVPALFLKLVYGHLVREEPYRPV